MKKTVLVVEDEPIIGEMISIILEEEGFDVISLSDTGRVRDRLQAHEIALVMLDLNLGKESGAVLCEYIKGQDDLKHIPVILVSANMDIEKIKDQCGADDLIKKPFELDHFIGKVYAHTQTA